MITDTVDNTGLIQSGLLETDDFEDSAADSPMAMSQVIDYNDW